jgi:hypothetical protein
MKLSMFLAAAVLATACTADDPPPIVAYETLLEGSKDAEAIPMHHALHAVFRELVGTERHEPGAGEAKLRNLGLDEAAARAVLDYAIAAEDELAHTLTALGAQFCNSAMRLAPSRAALAAEITASERVVTDKRETIAVEISTVVSGANLEALLAYARETRSALTVLTTTNYLAKLEAEEVDPAAYMARACDRVAPRTGGAR